LPRGISRGYRGEKALLLFQNLHRYTLYGALVLLVFLWLEALSAFFRGLLHLRWRRVSAIQGVEGLDVAQ
jgi:hypothetical protein